MEEQEKTQEIESATVKMHLWLRLVPAVWSHVLVIFCSLLRVMLRVILGQLCVLSVDFIYMVEIRLDYCFISGLGDAGTIVKSQNMYRNG